MNIENIALVRATNVIPFDGVIKTISNSKYLSKNSNTEFAMRLSDLLKKLAIIPPIDFTKISEDYFVTKAKEDIKILKEYLPYTSDYNSMVLFSLNGLVPDDEEHGFGNNVFSNKKCAIIEPLAAHIHDVVSITPTDTAVKGNVILSPEAIILIEEEFYQNLESHQKQQLDSLNLTVKTFRGNLSEVVQKELKNTGKYIPERLSLTRQDGGFQQSETSSMQIKAIQEIAIKYGIPQILFYNLLTKNHDYLEQMESVKDELDNSFIVLEHYLTVFLEQLLTVMNVSEDIAKEVRSHLFDRNFMNMICGYIKEYGIENYKVFVDCYNQGLKKDKNDGSLLTPQEIVDLYNYHYKK